MKTSIWILAALTPLGTAFAQVPQVQSLTPPSAAPGSSVPLSIYGMGFTASSTVYVNGAKVSSQNAGRQLSITVETPSTPQTLRIQVANGSIISLPYSFPVASALPPQPSGPGFDSAFAAPGVANLAPSVTADFNGDGIPDLAFMANSDSASGSIEVLLGQGNGQFTQKQAFAYLGNWGSITAVSLNNNGKVDLIFDSNSNDGTAGNPGTAYVAWGNGDGTFQTPVPFAQLSGAPLPNSIAFGDFAGIGYVAVFLGTADGYDISEYYGSGEFTTPLQVLPGYKIADIAVGDFLNTGLPDLILATDQGLGIAIDNGGNNIQPVLYTLPEALTCVVVGDFNNDGNLDVVAGDAAGGFYPILGDGKGDLIIHPPVNLPTIPSSVVTGDFNNDGKLDLIWGFASGGTLTMLGNGDGTFTAVEDDPTNLASPQIHGDVYLYPAADYNNDGRLDLVDDSLTGGGGPYVSLQAAVSLLNVTSLNFGTIQFGHETGPETLVLSDIGSFPLTISSASITGPNAADFQLTQSCSSPLSIGSSCEYLVVFKPSVGGTESAKLTITDNGGGAEPSPQVISMSGVGTTPVSPNPTSLTFTPTYPQGGSQTITVTNLGYSGLQITSVTLTPGNGTPAGDFTQTNNCTGALTSGATCTITVSFLSQTTNAESAAITINNNDPAGPVTVSLTGQESVSYYGYPYATPATLNFPGTEVGTVDPTPMTITVTNFGSQVLNPVIQFQTGNTADFPISSSTCGPPLNSGQNCQITVFFIPQASGARSAAITIGGTSDGNPAVATTVTVNGTGLLGSVFLDRISPSAITLANASAGFTLTLEGANINSGSQVQIDGRALAATYSQSGIPALTVTVPAGLITTMGTKPITVGNSGVPVSNPLFLPVGSTLGAPLFANASGSPLSGPGPVDQVLVADLNGDGKQDLVVTGIGTAAVVFLGNGDGTFTVGETLSAAFYYYPAEPNNPNPVLAFSSLAGDFNGDGNTDIAVIGYNGGLAVYLGAGNGTFTPAGYDPQTGAALGQPYTYAAVSTQPYAVAADGNNDGKLDLYITDTASGVIWMLLGTGNGAFNIVNAAYGGSGPLGIAAGDFNGDDILDLAIADSTSNTALILIGKGDGITFSTASVAVGTNPQYLAAADFNGDGKIDLAVSNANSNSVSILKGNGDGTFTAGTPVTVGNSPRGIAAGDLNGDGKLDLAVVNNTDNTVSILLGKGDGTFTAEASATAVSTAPVWAAIGDWNNDGHLDLATANQSGTVSVLLNGLPVATPSTNTLSFGSQNAGEQSAGQKVVLTNTGAAILTLTSIAFGGANAADFHHSTTCGTLPATLAPSASCNVNIAFDPSKAGSETATLQFTDNSGGVSGATQRVSLTGTGVVTVTLTPATLSFGYVGVKQTSPARTVQVTNSSAIPITIGTITIAGTNPGDFAETNNCGTTLAAAASCTVTVKFTPSGAGSRAATLSIPDSGTGSPQTVSLSGIGTGKPVALLSKSSLTFPATTVGTASAPQSVTVTNNGGANLIISAITASGDFQQKNSCTAALAPGKSCGISVTFTPTTKGTRSGVLTITDNGVTTTQQVKLTGAGE